MMPAPLLSVERVGLRFGAFVALRNLTVAFDAGGVTAVIGPNGAGKSSLFNVLSGLFPPTTGTLRFKGRELSGLRQHRFARLGIARSFQITNVFPELSVIENVRVAVQAMKAQSGLWTNRDAHRGAAAEAEAVLHAVGLADRAHRTAKLLAHGEQRALDIAIALAADPELLLLDEPTAGMGPEETKDMVALIARLADARTVLLVEHKMKMVLGLSRRIVVLHHGEIIADGSPADIQADTDVRRVYLGQSHGYA